MKKIIIPVDFSECSLETAHYAIGTFAVNPEVQLHLYYMYRKPAEEPGANLAFESVKYGLSPEVAARVHTHAELGHDFPHALCSYAQHIGASMIATCLAHSTLKLIDLHPCPVLVVPDHSESREIRRVAITSDFHNVEHTTPVGPILQVLELFKPALYIVNVNSEYYVSLNEEYQVQKDKLAEMFADYDPEFDFIARYDFEDSIRQFVADKEIDLLITIPRNHGFIDSLFREHHTRKLVEQSAVPVLAAHE